MSTLSLQNIEIDVVNSRTIKVALIITLTITVQDKPVHLILLLTIAYHRQPTLYHIFLLIRNYFLQIVALTH